MTKIEAYIPAIIAEKLGRKTVQVRRFATGLTHFVFDVLTENDFPCVVRIARPERTTSFRQGIRWHEELGR